MIISRLQRLRKCIERLALAPYRLGQLLRCQSAQSRGCHVHPLVVRPEEYRGGRDVRVTSIHVPSYLVTEGFLARDLSYGALIVPTIAPGRKDRIALSPDAHNLRFPSALFTGGTVLPGFEVARCLRFLSGLLFAGAATPHLGVARFLLRIGGLGLGIFLLRPFPPLVPFLCTPLSLPCYGLQRFAHKPSPLLHLKLKDPDICQAVPVQCLHFSSNAFETAPGIEPRNGVRGADHDLGRLPIGTEQLRRGLHGQGQRQLAVPLAPALG
mmetsp:Transcript_33617/g.68631  ORF Transcript_33617/g.68631 Transcript_33617/m.68631 type:complete len:268 (-) Transcript_33617:380-1183(-)